MKDKLRQRTENHNGWCAVHARAKLTTLIMTIIINLSVDEQIQGCGCEAHMVVWEEITWVPSSLFLRKEEEDLQALLSLPCMKAS